jgi:transcription initiation factor TFIID TATA-box-binding protein
MNKLQDDINNLQANDIVVSNIVATATPQNSVELDLQAIQTDFEEKHGSTTVNKNQTLTLSFDEDEISQLLFDNANIFFSGYTDPSQLQEQYTKVTTLLQDVLDISYDLDVTNLITQKTYDVNVNMNELILQLGLENVEYNPESFVGAFYHYQETMMLIFTKQFETKVMVMGETDYQTILNAFDSIEDELQSEDTGETTSEKLDKLF